MMGYVEKGRIMTQLISKRGWLKFVNRNREAGSFPFTLLYWGSQKWANPIRPCKAVLSINKWKWETFQRFQRKTFPKMIWQWKARTSCCESWVTVPHPPHSCLSSNHSPKLKPRYQWVVFLFSVELNLDATWGQWAIARREIPHKVHAISFSTSSKSWPSYLWLTTLRGTSWRICLSRTHCK